MNGGTLHICGLSGCNRSFCDKCVPLPVNLNVDQVEFHCPGCHVDSEYDRKKTKDYQPAAYHVYSFFFLLNSLIY